VHVLLFLSLLFVSSDDRLHTSVCVASGRVLVCATCVCVCNPWAVWYGCLQLSMCVMMVAVCCHSDGGSGDEAQREQYCEVTSRTYSAQQLNNEVNDEIGTFELQFVCEIEVRRWRAVLGCVWLCRVLIV
jgi:hypothetical protein